MVAERAGEKESLFYLEILKASFLLIMLQLALIAPIAYWAYTKLSQLGVVTMLGRFCVSPSAFIF